MKTKIYLSGILFFFICFNNYAGEPVKEIEHIFSRTKEIWQNDNGFLWGQNLEVPILLIDTLSNKIYSNEPNKFVKDSSTTSVYIGTYNKENMKLQSPLKIGNKNYAILYLPLPKDSVKVQKLILHETFHCLQPRLNLLPESYHNSHVNEMEARFWIKLELRALQLALNSENETQKQAITDAICFRQYRRALFSNCDSCENRFEIHDGLAEYTAHKLLRTPQQFKEHFSKVIDELWNSQSFTQNFALITGPIYAFLLDKKQSTWRSCLSSCDDLAVQVEKIYEIELPFSIYLDAEERSVLYQGAQILGEELDLAENKKEKKNLHY